MSKWSTLVYFRVLSYQDLPNLVTSGRGNIREFAYSAWFMQQV